ncbi:MAG: MgtC/SapB family protein, partial [Thermofilum sp.]|nr:MgtC/SapB family protein [Thermofilum sp.]
MLPLRAAAQPVDLQLLAKMAVSFIAGALIGLERERAKQEGAPGVRSVGFISLLGALTTALPLHLPTGGQLQLVVSVPLALSAVSVIAIYSYERAREERGAGVTTQLAL